MTLKNISPVITGIGVVAPNGIGKEEFWEALEAGRDGVQNISSFDAADFAVKKAAEVKDFNPEQFLESKSTRNLDKSALLLAASAKMLLNDANLSIDPSLADKVGISTGTTFSHLNPIVEFDKEVLAEGLSFSNPGLFPSTVINAASSHTSILFNIQGFNTTVSTGYTSGLTALRYAIDALETKKAEVVLASGVDILIPSLFLGFIKLGYMSGIKGPALSCPFDKRRNGPILGEGAGAVCVEEENRAKKRKTSIYARIKSVSSYFDAFQMSKMHPQGEGLEKAIRGAISESGIELKDVDYISSCANSSDLDKIEVMVLKKIFSNRLGNIPVSSIKSMIGETFSASGILQIISCIGAMHRDFVPPTLNYKDKDPDCDIDCVPNKKQDKDVKIALVISSGPGGYSGAAVLEKYNNS